jgi:hypothetical protein
MGEVQMPHQGPGGLADGSRDERLERFFRFLGERLTDENNASDVLYDAFKAFDEFRSVVVDCLKLPSTGPLEIARERAIEASRPDFLVTGEGQVFLIEVKLFDRNYHYDEYNQLHKSIRLLTAHKPDQKLEGWCVVRWRDLIDKLEQTNHRINVALAKYFRRVTMTKPLQPICLGRPQGILRLNRAIEWVIERYESGSFRATIYTRGRDNFSETSSGYYYELKHRGKPKRCAWPCFYLVYTDDREGIELGIRQDWHRGSYDRMFGALKRSYGERLGTDGVWCFVDMPDDDFNHLISCGDMEEQLKILSRFLAEFNGVIETCL